MTGREPGKSAKLGFKTIHYNDAEQLRAELKNCGVEV